MTDYELRELIHWLETNEHNFEKGWWEEWPRAATVTIFGANVRRTVPNVLCMWFDPDRAKLLMLWIDSHWQGAPKPTGSSRARWINQLRKMLPFAAKSPHPDARRQK